MKTVGDPERTPRSVASDLGLHCLPMSHRKDARLIWVKHLPKVKSQHINSVCFST